MKKFLLFIVITIGIGIGLYYVGTNIASDKIVDKVSNQLTETGQLDAFKEALKNDPELRRHLAEGNSVDTSTLPFSTKEQATRVLVKRVGIGRLQEIQAEAQRGMTDQEKAALWNELQTKFTDEEILAFKAVLYNELKKQ